MDESSNKFTTLMTDIGEVKVRFRNYLNHQAQQKKRKKMANETTIVPNIFTSTKIYTSA